MSILSAVTAMGQAVWEGLAATDDSCAKLDAKFDCDTDQAKSDKGLHTLTSFIAVIEVCVAVIGALCCCLGAECACHVPRYSIEELEGPPQSGKASKIKKHERRRRISGWIQVACGAISMFIGISITVLSTTAPPIIDSFEVANIGIPSGIISWPIWGGALYIISGSLGAANENTYLIVPYLVMSIVAANCAVGQAVWEALAADFKKGNDDDRVSNW
ncbi:uncharacterized protein [Amphiura filiformis]|uniref:uncharacterized protein n=1 Tax=Amphiura filiformis TaxID=82378 RepID=UPI003B211CBE